MIAYASTSQVHNSIDTLERCKINSSCHWVPRNFIWRDSFATD
jgi:hypothetical protein